MAIQLQSPGGNIPGVGAEAQEGLHTINKPQDYGSLGHYAMVLTTGTMAAGMAANGELIQMRWIDSTRLCLIYEVRVLEFRNITTAFAAGVFNFQAILARNWSADGTGGANPSVADPQGQLRTSMGASLFSTGFRLATTAALGAGTKTLDTVPVGACYGNVGSTPAIAQYYIPAVTTPVIGGSGNGVTLFKCDTASGEHPIVLASNGGSTSDGLVVRATVPGTGTWIASFLVKWAEVTAF